VADAAAGQSGFIAGFAYYELSRQSAANAERVPWYPILLLGAFTCSVVCSGITAYLHLQTDECDCEALEERRQRRSYLAVKLAYWCNRMAFYLYCVSMPFMGPVYNPSPPPPTPGIKEIALGYHMLIIGAVAAVLDIIFAVRDCLEPRREAEELSDEVDVNQYQSMDSMGNRALLMVGFIQHASARFVQLQQPPDGREYELYLNSLFPLVVSVGCVCLQLVVYMTFMSTTQLRTSQLSTKAARCLFVLFRISEFFFKLGVFLVLAGASLTGWGCSCPCGGSADYGTAVGPCGASSVPEGACYARVAYVPLTCCVASILLIVFFQCWSRCATHCDEDDGRTDEDSELGGVSVALDSLATVGTLAAGFVMYNITTFNTDVIRGPFPADDRPLFGLNPWGFYFLWANWLAFSMGLGVVVCVQIINARANALETTARKRYLAAVDSMLLPIEIMSLVSLISFVLAFGLLGMAKMAPPRVEGFIASLLFLVLLARQLQKIWTLRKAAEGSERTSVSVCHAFPASVLKGKLDAITGPSMIFGGFAYNGVSFLFRSGTLLAPTYVVGMATSFSSALYLTFTSAIIDFNLARLSPKAKEAFAATLGETLVYARRSYALCLAAFMMAFTVMGYIKLWDYGSPLSEQAVLSWKYGVLQLVGGLLGLSSLWRLRNTIREAARLARNGSDAQEPAGPELCKVRQMLANAKSGSSSTAFQVGNVFYEVLFSGVNLQDPVANFAYFGFAVTTLVLGSIALMISCELFFAIEELSDSLKCALAARLTTHFRLIRILYMASLTTWLCSMFFSSQVKYPELWWASFSWSCGGFVVLASACAWIRCQRTAKFSELSSDSSLDLPSEGS